MSFVVSRPADGFADEIAKCRGELIDDTQPAVIEYFFVVKLDDRTVSTASAARRAETKRIVVDVA